MLSFDLDFDFVNTTAHSFVIVHTPLTLRTKPRCYEVVEMVVTFAKQGRSKSGLVLRRRFVALTKQHTAN